MPQLPRYTYTGPVDHTVAPDRSQMVDKSVIVTGGANGIGEEAVRQYVAAGAFVTFADMAVEKGHQLEKELNDAAGKEVAVFVKCDIRNWDEQITMFETAKSRSPCKSVDIVIANAGISRSSGDSLWNLDGSSLHPTQTTNSKP
jgi:NAD(P)-dependent dehydrogenase (short-subunit alcohol dehydrogenase family)